MIKPIKRYILWVSNGQNQYSPTEFDTVEEALIAEKYSADWYLTETVNSISAYASFTEPKDNKTK